MKITWIGPKIYYTEKDKEKGIESEPHPDYDGVYVMAEKIGENLTAKYVGQGDLASRLSDHRENEEKNPKLTKWIRGNITNIQFFYVGISNQEERNDVERSMFEIYGGTKSLINIKTPPGNIIDVNPPF